MQTSTGYRVVSRSKFAVVMVILLGFVAVGVWVGLDHLAAYGKQLEELAAAEPHEAGAIITRLLHTLAVLNGAVLCSLAALIIRHGWQGWRSF